MTRLGAGAFLAGALFFVGPQALVAAALALRASGRIDARYLVEERLDLHMKAAESASRARGVELPLLLAVASVESSGNPSARSGAGAVGLMQLMPATARELAPPGRPPRLEDPAQSLDLGALYLRRQLDRFASEELALAAYNAGPGAVQSWIDRGPPPEDGTGLGDWIPYGETRSFVSKVQHWRERWRRRLAASAPAPRAAEQSD